MAQRILSEPAHRIGLPEVKPFNVQNCIDLHNQIVRVSVTTNPEIRIIRGYFNYWRDEMTILYEEEVISMRRELGEAMCQFLDSIDIVSSLNASEQWSLAVSFTPEVREVCQPGEMVDCMEYYEPPDAKIICLYRSQDQENGRGLVFDLSTYSATYIAGYHDSILDDDMRDFDPDIWVSLEDILQEWLDRIEHGRYVSTSVVDKTQLVFSETTAWKARSYHDGSIRTTLHAWDAYVDTILGKMAVSSKSNDASPEQQTLASAEVLDTHYIWGFRRAFLLSARRPPSTLVFIAPGLVVPTVGYLSRNLADVRRRQLEEDIEDDRGEGPNSLLSSVLFPVAASHSDLDEASLTHGLNFTDDKIWEDTAALKLPTDTDNTTRFAVDPSPFRSGFRLFQSGKCPFGPDHNARLDLILAKWKELLDTDVWTVGPHGVEGGLEWLQAHKDRQSVLENNLGLDRVCQM